MSTSVSKVMWTVQASMSSVGASRRLPCHCPEEDDSIVTVEPQSAFTPCRSRSRGRSRSRCRSRCILARQEETVSLTCGCTHVHRSDKE